MKFQKWKIKLATKMLSVTSDNLPLYYLLTTIPPHSPKKLLKDKGYLLPHITVDCRDSWLWCSWIHALNNVITGLCITFYPSILSSFPRTLPHFGAENICVTFKSSKSFSFLTVPNKVLYLSFLRLAWVTHLSLNKLLCQGHVNDLTNSGYKPCPESSSNVRHILTM